MANRVRGFAASVPRREKLAVAAAMALGVAAVLAYVLATRSHSPAGDERYYIETAQFWADGMLWWTTTPFGEAHASAWKAPAYPAWVGTLYWLGADSPLRVEIVQSLIAAISVFGSWLLARRLFGPAVAVAAAFVVALFPLVFEYYGLLFPEALAIPLTLLALILFLDRSPTVPLAAATGLAIGAGLLVRPTSFFLFAGVATAWIVAAGVRRGAAMTAIAVVTAILVVAPWTIRNISVTEGFVPISVQDAAAYGTFNAETAADTENRWAWRPVLENPPEVIERGAIVTEAEFRSELQEYAFDYIREHPASVAKAFFWNGVVRFWDLRRPGDAVDEVAFQGRSRAVRWIGLGMYYALLPLALLGLWRIRDRRALAASLAALAAAASLTFTVIAGTRYRAPLEPVIVILAMSAIVPFLQRRREA